MAKKSSGKHYVSKGLVPTVSKKASAFIRKGERTYSDRMTNILRAYREGRPVSDSTLLEFGPRNANEERRYRELGGVVRKEKNNNKR